MSRGTMGRCAAELYVLRLLFLNLSSYKLRPHYASSQMLLSLHLHIWINYCRNIPARPTWRPTSLHLPLLIDSTMSGPRAGNAQATPRRCHLFNLLPQQLRKGQFPHPPPSTHHIASTRTPNPSCPTTDAPTYVGEDQDEGGVRV